MKQSRRSAILLSAATATLCSLALTSLASAQFAVQQDGHANDANNQVGSGGYNGQRPGALVTPNDIVNRNVTGLSGFSGPIHESDPRAFTGPTAGSSFDVWNARSQGVPSAAGANADPFSAQPFYGQARFVPPPAGSLPLGFSGGYIGTVANSPSSLSNGLNTVPLDVTGLQARTQNRDNFLLDAMLNHSTYGQVSNDVDQQNLIDTAAFYGQQTRLPGENGFITATPQLPDAAIAEEAAIFKMRAEVRNTATGLRPQPPTNSALNPNNVEPTPGTLGQPIDRPLGDGLGSVDNSPLGGPLTSSQISNDPLSSTGTIPANVRERPMLVPAAMQSSLLETLQQRLAKTNDVAKAMADAQANAQQAPPPSVKAKTPTPQSGGPVVGPATPDNTQGPVKVSSLAVGVHAKGLRDLLSAGEDLIKDGKYDSAILKFNQAQRVAPNNPLAPLGRAEAELAGGYYSRAEADLRQVFRTDPEMMLAQFDLGSLISKERQEFLRNDLKTLAASNPDSERPMFLLAYLDYNTGNAGAADDDINGAEKRSGKNDWALRLLRQRWALPSNAKGVPAQPPPQPQPDMNK